jgi:hypothetical protein
VKVVVAVLAETHVAARTRQLQIMIQKLSMMTGAAYLTFQVAQMQRLATTTQTLHQMTNPAYNQMSAEFAVATASLKANVTATETYWMSAEFVVVAASLKASVTVTETYWMSVEFVVVAASQKASVTATETYWTNVEFVAETALQKARATVTEHSQHLAMTVMVFA